VPKAFTPKEKAAIHANLLRAGMRHFERHGIRSARVDAICGDVGIAKGSFYAFFPSKEELFMAIVAEREALHRADMLAMIEAGKGSAASRARRFFDLILSKIETDPVLNIVLAHGEILYLQRKLGVERFVAAQDEDRAFAREAARRWRSAGGGTISASDLLSLMTIALSVAAHRKQMTEDQYRPAIALLRDVFVARLTGTVS
jgi:AcrR family transcriptional regulator